MGVFAGLRVAVPMRVAVTVAMILPAVMAMPVVMRGAGSLTRRTGVGMIVGHRGSGIGPGAGEGRRARGRRASLAGA